MLRTLTALRFPAALAVFVWHAPLTRPIAEPFSLGYLGVGFFFLLSGFILTYNYNGNFSLRNFYVARVARIYPVHLLAMAVAIPVLAAAGGGPEWNDAGWSTRLPALALQAVLMQSWFASPQIHFTGNGPAWSLSDEAFFYAVFPFVLAAGCRWFARSSEWTLLAAAAALWAALTAIVAHVSAVFDQWNLFVFPAIRFVDFAVGMLLAGAFMRARGPASSALGATLLEAGAVFGLIFGIALTAVEPQSMRFAAAMMPFCAALIFIFAMERGLLSRALRRPEFVLLGEASYAFYLLHLPAIRIAQLLTPNAAAAFVIAILICTGCSIAVFRYVETPLRRAIRARFAPSINAARPPGPPVAAPVSQG